MVNAGSGATTLAATQDLSLGTVTTRDSTDIGGGRNRARVESSRDVGSRLRTQGDASLLAGNNLSGRAVDLAAEGNLALAAGRDVVLAAGRNEQSVDIASYASGKSGGGLMGGKKVTRSMEIKAETSTAQEGALSGKNVSIQAGRDIALEGGLYAARQTLALEAGRDLTLAAASDQVQASLSQSSKSGAKVKQQSEQRSSNMANGAVLVAGSDLSLKSSGDTTLVGSGLAAGGQITVKTGGDLALVAAQSDRQVQGSDYQQGKRKAVTHTREESETRQLLSTITAGGQVAIDVGGNFSAEIGEKNADGSLRADRMTATGIDQGDSRQQVRITGSGSGGSTLAETAKKALAEGIRAEADDAFTPGVTRTGTAALNQFLESGLVKVGNIPQLERQLKQILGDGAGLTQRDATGQITLTVAGQSKVQEVYNALKLTEHFDVKKFPDGQTAQLVTLVVAIALTICTAGAGAASLGAVAASAMGATATTAISATFAAGVINAAAIGMASTMIGQLAGGASFDQAFKAGVKAAATSAVTAGVTYGIGELVNAVPTNSVSGSTVQVGTNAATPGSNAFQAMTTPQYWAQTGLNALAKGAISQAQGGKFADGVVGSVIGSFAASGAGIIGDMTQGNTLANMISHAVLGCAVAAAGKQDCASGALGGASSALIARAIDGGLSGSELGDTARKTLIASGSVAGSALLVGALGGESLTAGNAAANEVLNNYLDHRRPSLIQLSEKERYENAVAGCNSGNSGACTTRNELAALSQQRDRELASACSGSTPDLCNAKARDAIAMGNTVFGSNGSLVYANSQASGAIRNLNTATIGTPTRPDSFQDQVAKSTAEGLLLEGQNQLVGALLAASGKGIAATNAAVKEYFASTGVVVGDEAAARIALNFGRDGDRFTVVAEQMAAAKNANWVTPQGNILYPPGNGAVPGTEFQTSLQVGMRVDRYGGTSRTSSFLAPKGISIEQRALPPTTNLAIRDEYVVVRPFQVEQSNVMPWFGRNGMGQQFDTKGGVGLSIEELVKQGYLRKVTP